MRAARLLALVFPLMVLGVPVSAVAEPAALNDWHCRPSAEQPRPVVLVHGIADGVGAWRDLAPRLAERGRCVFALEYGKDPRTFGQVNGFAPLAQSAAEIAAFAEQVRERTGAARVDLVGHSEGGLLSLVVSRELGAEKVGTAVLLAPPTHGTTLGGLVTAVDEAGLRPAAEYVLRANVCPACADMVRGSRFITELTAPPIAAPGVRYTILASAHDQVSSPGAWSRSSRNRVWSISSPKTGGPTVVSRTARCRRIRASSPGSPIC